MRHKQDLRQTWIGVHVYFVSTWVRPRDILWRPNCFERWRLDTDPSTSRAV